MIDFVPSPFFRLVLPTLAAIFLLVGCGPSKPPQEEAPTAPKPLSSVEKARELIEKKEMAAAITALTKDPTPESLDVLLSLLRQDKLHDNPVTHSSLQQQMMTTLAQWPGQHDKIWDELMKLMKERQAQDAWLVNAITGIGVEWSVKSPEYSIALAEAVVNCPDKGLKFTFLGRLKNVMTPEASRILLKSLPSPLDRDRLTIEMLGLIVGSPDPEALPLLKDLVSGREYPLLLEPAALALCRSGDESAVTVVETRYQNESDFDTRQKLARALMIAPQPRFRELLAQGLAPSNPRVLRLDAARALAQTTTAGDAPLIQMYLSDPDPRIRFWMQAAAVKSISQTGSLPGWIEARDKAAAAGDSGTALILSKALNDDARIGELTGDIESKRKLAAGNPGLLSYLGKKKDEVLSDFPTAKVTALSRDMSTSTHLIIFHRGWALVVPSESLHFYGNDGAGPYERISLLPQSPREVFGIHVGDSGTKVLELHGAPRESDPVGSLSYDLEAGGIKARVIYDLDNDGKVSGIDIIPQ